MDWMRLLAKIGAVLLAATYEEDVRIYYSREIQKAIHLPNEIALLIWVVTWGLLYLPAIIPLAYYGFKKKG